MLPKIARLKLKSGLSLLETEKSMLEEFQLQAPSLVGVLPQSDWEWLSLAQHHGMATRLLDWTGNPLAALWFAVRKPPLDKKHGVVWVFDPHEDDYVKPEPGSSPFVGARTRVFAPKHIARRIIAQSGWFTVHKYAEKKGFIPLERHFRYIHKLAKLVIPHEHFAGVRYDLSQCGVNPASMLTDLDGLCSHIEWRHSLLEDERESRERSLRRGAARTN